MHQMRPVAQSLSTERLQSGTEFSLLDLLPLSAMRLNTDAKGIFIDKRKCIKIGGVHDRRRSNPAVIRSSLMFWPLLQHSQK
jgi:hypothetical protein